MNYKLNYKLILAAVVMATGTMAIAQDEPNTTFDKTKTSYAIGYQMGIEFLGRQGSEFELDVEQAIQGIRDANAKKDPAFSKEDMVLNYKGYENRMKQKQFEAFKKLAEENQKRSDDF